MKIAINSNANFYQKTTPILIPTLLFSSNTITKDNIVVICGGASEDKVEFIDNVKHIFVKYDSIDLTSFIYISEHGIDDKEFFYLHDTTKVCVNFIPNINSTIALVKGRNANVTDIRLCSYEASMNIGWYLTAYVQQFKDEFIGYKNFDLTEHGRSEAKTKALHTEDILFKKVRNEYWFCTHRTSRLIENIYGGNTKRIEEYFPQVDLYKYKSNWDMNNGKFITL